MQTVLVAPALLLGLMLIVQFGLYFHAKSVAEAAAQEGAAAARRFDGSQGAAASRATSYLNELGPRIFSTRSISASRSPETASVTVTGTVVSLVPGLKLRVAETAEGPVERYVPTSAGAAP